MMGINAIRLTKNVIPPFEVVSNGHEMALPMRFVNADIITATILPQKRPSDSINPKKQTVKAVS